MADELYKRYRGLHAHRLDANPREKAFAEAWQKFNKKGVSPFLSPPSETLLAQLLYTGGEPGLRPDPSDRDFEVAATVIQWLGSPVGQDFLEEVAET